MLNYEMTAKAKELHAAMIASVEKCEAMRKAGQDFAGKDGQLSDCRKAANKVNAEILSDLVKSYVAKAEADGAQAVMADYLSDYYFDGYAVRQHSADDGGDVYVDSVKVRIPFSAIDSASKTVKLNSNGAWRKYIRIFADNCVRFDSIADKGEEKQFIVAADSLPDDLRKLRDSRPNWKNFRSKNALHEQFNELVSFVMPDGMGVFMLKSDLKPFIKGVTSLKKATSMATAGIAFDGATDKALEELLFRFIYTRKNNLAIKYDFGYKQAEANGQPAPVADGGEVSAPAAEETPAVKPEPEAAAE